MRNHERPQRAIAVGIIPQGFIGGIQDEPVISILRQIVGPGLEFAGGEGAKGWGRVKSQAYGLEGVIVRALLLKPAIASGLSVVGL